MKAYIAVGKDRRDDLSLEIAAIAATFTEHGIRPFVFVDEYRLADLPERDLMKQAFSEIDTSAILFAEVSEKAIGVGIELGYAKGISKFIVCARKENAEHSTTAAGSSDFVIVYSDATQLRDQLTLAITKAKNMKL
ncbi:MAG TPA: hypothetical protein VGD40_02290 [Chryseosolibacter sp.]